MTTSQTEPSSAASYLVLARKWRPRVFDELVGQEHITRALTNAIEQGRVAHAFLFTGARGVGKTSAARVLARALNCEKGPTPSPCGVCARCEEITQGTAVDILEIDAASNRGIDDIRTLRESVRYLPSVARRKVVIVDEVHMLTTEAFNALLKTLEEPPPHVVFVLATTDPHKVPVTILSRCQRYDFKRVGLPRMVEHLSTILGKEGLPVARGGLVLVARESEGSVRDALSLLDQVLSYAGKEATEVSEQAVAEVLGVADRALLSALGRALCGRDVVSALGGVEEAFNRGYDMAQLGRALLAHFRDLVVVKVVANPGHLVDFSAEELVEAQKQLAQVDASILEQHFHYLAKAVEDVSKSPEPRASLEMALVRMARAEPIVPLVELLERLEALEKGAPPRAPAGAAPGSGRGAQPGPPKQVAAPPSGCIEARFAAPAESAPVLPSSPPATAASPPAASPPVVAPPVVAAAVASPAPLEASAGPPIAGGLASWESVVIAVRERKPALAAILEHAALLSLDASALVLGFPKGSFTFQQAAAKESLAALTTLVRAQLGFAKLEVQLRELSPAALAAVTQAASAAATGAKAQESGEVAASDLSTAPSTPSLASTAGDQSAIVSLIELDRRRQDDERERRRREASEHPVVRAAIDKFGAEIKEIKTDLE